MRSLWDTVPDQNQKERDKAIADFQHYLDINPIAPDRQEVETIITTLQAARDKP